jgi:hypothetical protein
MQVIIEGDWKSIKSIDLVISPLVDYKMMKISGELIS